MGRIYLDTAAATPLDKRVRRAMLKAFAMFGNPSSIHKEGVLAEQMIALARKSVAEHFGAHADEIVFTSGGTESNSLAVLGVAAAYEKEFGKTGHMVVSSIEHASVLAPCRTLAARGWEITYVPVTNEGIVQVSELKQSLRPDTVLVSIMYANNEIGTLQPLEEIKKIIRKHKQTYGGGYPYFHTDACQATRFYDLKVEKLGVDLLTANGAKIYGPKGSALLYVRRGVKLEPIIFGGEQERGLRSGTENVSAIVGFAEALIVIAKARDKEVTRLEDLRRYFIKKLMELFPEGELNGSEMDRLPNNVNFSFSHVSGELLVLQLDHHGVAVSTGSACSYNAKDESYVIMALGKDKQAVDSSVRFSFSRDTTKRQLDTVLKLLPKLIALNTSITK